VPFLRTYERKGHKTLPDGPDSGKAHAYFTVSPAATRAWWEREIGECLREGNLKAAEFHYWWLVAEMAQAARPPA
jgi:hypothetical protein